MSGRWKILLPVVLAAGLFLLLPGRRQFATSHEARVAQVAREMAANGWPWDAMPVQVNRVHLVKTLGVLRMSPDYDAPPMRVNPWVVPILNGEVRLQKPPLPYWCAAALFRLVGVGEGAARFVPMILGTLATLLLFDLSRLLYGRAVAWVAAVVWCTTYLITDDYRLAMADPYLAFFTLSAVLAWVRASGFGGGALDPRTATSGASIWVLAFYTSLALGALAKGPLIFLHVAMPLMLFHICFPARIPRSPIAHTVGILLFLAISLPWPLTVMHQVPNAMQLWRYESVGEISGENQEGLRGHWYYLMNLPLLAFPWVGAWLFSLTYPFRRKRGTVLFPLLWYGIALLFFTLVGQKKLPYLLPIMPAQAMMIAVAAAPLLRLATRGRAGVRGPIVPRLVVAVQVVIGLGWAVALPILVLKEHAGGWLAMGLAGGSIIVALWGGWLARSGGSIRWLAGQAVAYAAILFVFNNVVQTATANGRSPKLACQEMNAVAGQSGAAILVGRLPEEAAFYLPLHPRQPVAPRNYLVMVDDATGVNYRSKRKLPEPPPDPEHFKDWVPDAKVTAVRRVPMNAAPGDARWKVYELTVERTGMAAVARHDPTSHS